MFILKVKEALEILCMRADKTAEKLYVEEGPDWRDLTGTAHLYVRGILMPVMRIDEGNHSAHKAGEAESTIAMAGTNPDMFSNGGMLNPREAVRIARNVLEAEKTGKSLSDAVSADDLRFCASEFDKFASDVSKRSIRDGEHESVTELSYVLDPVNEYFAAVTQKMIAGLSDNRPEETGNPKAFNPGCPKL